MKVLYLAWLGSNNLGDVLMWHEFKDLSKKYLDWKRVQVIPSLSNVDTNNLRPYDLVVLGGGSIIHPKYINIMYNAVRQNKKVMIWGSGLDSLDQSLFSHELTDSDQYKLAEVVERSVYAGVRGPITFQLLKSMGINMNKVKISLDPGLLVEHKPINTSRMIKWDKDEKVIGLNWGTSYNKIYGRSEFYIEEHLVNAMKYFIKQGYKVHMYHVWWRDYKPCHRLFNRIGDKSNVWLDKNQYNQYEMIELMRQCEFTINFKLHANILSAVACVPFIALGYRMKVFDFTRSIELENYVLSTDVADLGDQIIRTGIDLPEKVGEIQTKVNKYASLARKNLTEPFVNHLYLY